MQVPYAWDVGPDDSVRLAHHVLLDLVSQALDRLVEVAGPFAPDIVAGGVSCFFHSIVGLDAAGRPVTPVLSWADSTSASEAAALRAQIDADWAWKVSGVPIHASYWPARVLRLRREQPRIRRWAGFPELLAEALTGHAVVSRSMASGTGLLDRAQGAWSSTLLRELAIDPGDLSPIVADDEPIGRLTAASARRWPPFAHIPWFAPWGDGVCGNVGLAATTPGKAASWSHLRCLARLHRRGRTAASRRAVRLSARRRDRGWGSAQRRRWPARVGEPSARALAQLAGARGSRDRSRRPRTHRAALYLWGTRTRLPRSCTRSGDGTPCGYRPGRPVPGNHGVDCLWLCGDRCATVRHAGRGSIGHRVRRGARAVPLARPGPRRTLWDGTSRSPRWSKPRGGAPRSWPFAGRACWTTLTRSLDRAFALSERSRSRWPATRWLGHASVPCTKRSSAERSADRRIPGAAAIFGLALARPTRYS